MPTFSRVFIDDYLIGGQHWLVRPLLVAMLSRCSSRRLLTWLQQYYLLRLETKLALATRAASSSTSCGCRPPISCQRFAGEIGSRVADQRQGRARHLGQAGDHGHRQPDDRVLRRADALYDVP